jgi:hypothetical protein
MPEYEDVAGWPELRHEFNVGFLCGSPSRLLCIDIDSEEGFEVLRQVSEEDTWETWQYETGNGRRILYRMPKGMEFAPSMKVTREDGAFFEILGDGRQSVLPPSLHVNGSRYKWLRGAEPKTVDEPAIVPDWLLLLQPQLTQDYEEIDYEKTVATGTKEGARNETIARLVGHMLAPAPIPIKEVYGWMRLYSEHRCHPPLDDSELKTIISSIYRREQASSHLSPNQREVKRLAKEYGIPYSDAVDMWRELGEEEL